MDKVDDACCRTCMYRGYVFGELGCFRYPPTVIYNSRDIQRNVRPLVTKDMWCGEYKCNDT